MSPSKEEQLEEAAFDGNLEVVKSLCGDPAVDVNWRLEGQFTPLFSACQAQHLDVVKFLLTVPGIDPNLPENNGATPMLVVCGEGHKEVVSLLLADPRVDVNKRTNTGATPCCIACDKGRHDVLSLLLADPRVEPNLPDIQQSPPLYSAAQNGNLLAVQQLLASGREIDTNMRSTLNNRTAAEQGREQPSVPRSADDTEEIFQRKKLYGPICADLIDDYGRDPAAVRHRLRRQTGLRDYFVCHLFALVVFYSDGLLKLKHTSNLSHRGTSRFFEMCTRLPLEVQMVLCNRIFGSPKDIILSKDSEPGFQVLSRSTTWL